MKIAFVHDFLTQYGGAERLLETLVSFFPDDQCDIYTLAYRSEAFPKPWLKSLQIKQIAPSLPLVDRYPQLYAPYLVSCIESLDFRGYDLVISSDLIFAKCVICPVGVAHICYMHTPARMLYPLDERIESSRGALSFFTMFQKSYLRVVESVALHRIDCVLTNSVTTASRISTYFHVSPRVVYSFVDIPRDDEFHARYKETSDYFLCISRLVPHKRLELAVMACSALHERLVVIGEGESLGSLQQCAGPTIEFRGFVSDDEKATFIGGSRALIVPGVEDLGLTPLEVMSYGKPVIAYGEGGVTETVVEGSTGLFFDQQSVNSLQEAITKFSSMAFNPVACREQAAKFSLLHFEKAIKSIVDEALLSR
jgi:glycosyltransferase involved in cell wall biosynthesis